MIARAHRASRLLCSAATPVNWITMAQQPGGVQAWLDAPFVSQAGFDSFLSEMRVVEVNNGRVKCTLRVGDHMANLYGTLHGGATSTLVDVLGTMALLTQDASRPGVSVDLNTSFTAAAKVGDTISLEGRVLKSGRRLGFTEVNIWRSDGTLVATGRHTKAL